MKPETMVEPSVSRWPGPVSDDRWIGRTRINAKRLRDGWGEFLAEFEWERMVTLTFDPARWEHLNAEQASRETFWWCGLAARLCRRPLDWAYAVEGGGGGWLHAHVLVAGVPEHRWGVIGDTWRSRNGRVDLRQVDDPAGAAAYLCKSAGRNGEVLLSDTLRRRGNTSVDFGTKAR